jgi:hypothetical protein
MVTPGDSSIDAVRDMDVTADVATRPGFRDIAQRMLWAVHFAIR